jgi:HEAT repeat protein
MRVFRTRFGIRAIIALVGLCALLFGAMRFSRDHRPTYLYARWLSDGDEGRRLHAVEELGGIGADGAVAAPALTRALLSDGAASVRKGAALSLAGVVSKPNNAAMTSAVAAALVAALRDKEPTVREAAAKGLGQIHPDPKVVIPSLLEAAGEENEWVRGAAIVALGLIQRDAGIDRMDVRRAIVAALDDGRYHIREMGI